MAAYSAPTTPGSVELSDLSIPPVAVAATSRQNLVAESFEQDFDDRQEPQHVADIEDVPPNGGYGWVCAACVFFINANTWGINSVSTASLVYVERKLMVPGMGNLLSPLPFIQYLPGGDSS